jgi:PAS domain S-box-containing protein
MQTEHQTMAAVASDAGPALIRAAGGAALLALAYFLVSHASLLLVMVDAQTKLVWIPSGIAVAALWRWGPALWPGALVGSFGFALAHGMGGWASAGFAAGSAAEAVVAALILRRALGFQPRMERLRDVFGLCLAGGIVGAGVASIGEVAGLVLEPAVPAAPLWWVCWLSRGLGVLLVAPVVFTWSAQPLPGWDARRSAELALIAALVVGVSFLVFGSMADDKMVSPLPYALFPLLLWCALRFGPRETATLMLVGAAFAVWGTANGNGPFIVGGREQNLVSLYLYLAVASVAALALAATIKERQLAEAIAQASERQYRMLVETMNEGMVAQDAGGRVSFANAAFCALLGYRREELKGRAVEDLIAPDGRALWLEQQTVPRARGGSTYEIDLIRKDGSLVSVSVSPRAIADERGGHAGSFALVTNITERRRADDLLRWIARATAPLIGEEFFRSLMRNLASAFGFRFAFITECADYPTTRLRTLAFWNGSDFQPNFEYELAGTPCEQTVNGARVCCVPERVGVAYPREAELGAQGYLGVPIWDSAGREVIGHVAFLSDGRMGEEVLANPLFQIFASRAAAELRRKRAEDVLRESEEKYRLLVENQTDLVIKLDAQRRCRFVSPSFCELFGHAEADLLGKPFGVEVAEDDHEASARAWEALGAPPHLAHYEERLMTRLGWRWFAWSAKALLDGGGAVAEVVAVGRDVTERKRAEEQSRQHLQQLAHVARVSALGEMATAIAHEINQPLTAIVGYTQASQRMLPAEAPPDLRHALERVAAQATRAGEIIRRLRSFLGKEEVQAQSVDANYLVTEVIGLARPEARQSGIQIRLELAKDLPQVRVDAIQIQQVVLNLVRNAIDAINGSQAAERIVIVRSGAGEEGTVRIEVEDSGPGIDTGAAARIFDAFYTTKSSGMGIGLAISRSIAEAHGGRLWLARVGAPGALFALELPVAD